MSIQNELSSEIAVAILTRENKDPKRLQELKELIFRVHSTLRGTDPDAHQERARTPEPSADKRDRLRR